MFYYMAVCIHLVLTPFFWKAFGAALFGFVFILVNYVAYQHLKYDRIPGPPRSSFWLGHFSSLYNCMAESNVLSTYLLENLKKYGHTIRLFMFHRPFVVVVEPEAVKDILTPGKHSPCTVTTKTEGYIFGARWQGSGLLLDYNEERMKLRSSVYDQLFQADYLKGCLPGMNSAIDNIMQEFYFLADGKTLICLSEKFERAILDIVCKVCFNREVNSTECLRDPFKAAVFTLLSARRKEKTDPWTNISYYQRDLRKSVREACALLRKTGNTWIEERMQKMSRGEQTPNDVLTTLIEFSKHPEISREDVLDDFMVFLVVILEHTPNTLAFLLRDATKNSDIYQRLIDEIDTAMAGKETVDAHVLDKLPYMEAVLRETMRMYPTYVESVHISNFDIVTKGVTIPKGTPVIVSPLLSGRNDVFFKDPMEFNPDRFLEMPISNSSIYFPYPSEIKEKFGRFGETALKLLLVRMLLKLKIHYFSDQAFTETNLPTLRPSRGGIVVFNKRSNPAPFIYDITGINTYINYI